jgi:hypothetical protein
MIHLSTFLLSWYMYSQWKYIQKMCTEVVMASQDVWGGGNAQ